MKTYRIAQIGTFDCENMGDLLFPIVLKKLIEKQGEPIEIDMFSPIGGSMCFFPQYDVYPVHQLQEKHLEHPYDAIIIGGGDLIRLDPSVVSYDRYEVTDATLWIWAYPILLGLTEKVPVLFNAPGVPFAFTDEQRVMVQSLLQTVDYISVRDENSRELLMQTGFSGNVQVVPDTITLIEYAFPKENLPVEEMERKAPISQWGDYVLFQLNGLEENVDIGAYISAIRCYHEKTGCKVVLMPIGYVHDDEAVLRQIFDHVSADMDYVVMLSEKLTPLEAAALIANAKGFIGTSLHGNVISYAYNVPAVAVNPADLTKVNGFYQLIGAPERVCTSIVDIQNYMKLLDSSEEHNREMVKESALEHVQTLFRHVRMSKKETAQQMLAFLKQIPLERETTFTSDLYWCGKTDDFSQTRFAKLRQAKKDGHYYEFKRMQLPANTFSVRFDPCEGYDYAVVADVKAVTDIGIFHMTPVNAACQDGYALFNTQDPQFSVTFNRPIAWIELSALIWTVNKSEVTAPLCAAIESSIHALHVNKELERQINVWKAYRKQAEEMQRLYLSEKKAPLNDTDKQPAECEKREKAYCEEMEGLHGNIDALEAGRDAMSAERDAWMERIRTIEIENAALREANQKYVYDFQIISNSQWWKLTAPGRRMLTTVKNTRVGGLVFKGLRCVKKEGIKKTVVKTIRYVLGKKADRILSKLQSRNAFINQLLQHPGVIVQADKMERYLAQTKPYQYRVLFVSHEMSLTGAPVVLLNFAKIVHESGNQAVIISPVDGPLHQEAERAGIPVAIVPDLFTTGDALELAYPFNAVVACTIASATFVRDLNGTDIPVIWWIHEAMVSYNLGSLMNMPQILEKNIHVYSVCEYAKNMLLKFRPQYQSNILPYYMDDFAEIESKSTFKLPEHDGKKVFTMVGTMEERKGQDILVQAIRLLPENVQAKCLFVIVAKKYHKPYEKMIDELCRDYPKNVLYYEQLNRDEIVNLYKETDCLICASRDDPLPCVITEALAVGKPAICSEHTGYAAILEEMNSGLVYHNDDPELLAGAIENYISKPTLQKELQRNTRRTYEKYFMREAFAKRAFTALNTHILKLAADEASNEDVGIMSVQQLMLASAPARKHVSVIIPTYNAGSSFDALLSNLENQTGVDELEIVIVDSGSKDDTVKICKKHGVRLIQISNEQFSHSGARNMGAQAATGEILLFMTQDAFPASKDWVEKLIEPIVTENVAAVSPIEKCPLDTDLYYRVASHIHINYLGNSQQDLLNEGMGDGDRTGFRARSALNDVTTAINCKIFMRFMYRHDFAEDLDMGMRLIRGGYRIKLMSSVQTVHGHNRPAGYYFKRTLVDTVTTSETIMQIPVAGTATQWDLAEMLGQGYGAMQWVYSALLADKYASLKNFHDAFVSTMSAARKLSAAEMKCVPTNDELQDDIMQNVAGILSAFCSESGTPRYEVIDVIRGYWENILHPYAEKNIRWNNEQAKEMLLCINKQLACTMGCELARLSPDDSMYPKIHQFTAGV